MSSCPAGLCSASTNGFLTQREVQTAANNNDGVSVTTQEGGLQLLFPSINFTESQSIRAWSFVADRDVAGDLPQLQVWRLFISTSYSPIHTVGNTSILQGSGPLYRYVLPTPIPVAPGDVLGIYIPRFQMLDPRFRDVGVGNTSTYYFQDADVPQMLIDINSYTPGSRLIPLVAVQFGKYEKERLKLNRTNLSPNHYHTLRKSMYGYHLIVKIAKCTT